MDCLICHAPATNLLPTVTPDDSLTMELVSVCPTCFDALWVPELQFALIVVTSDGRSASVPVISRWWVDTAIDLASAVAAVRH